MSNSTGTEERTIQVIGIIPIKATCHLQAGDYIGQLVPNEFSYVPKDSFEAIGIVDPFIRNQKIKPGDYFWLYLFPDEIEAFKTTWTHPAFDNHEQKTMAEKWIRNYLRIKYPATNYDNFIYEIEKNNRFMVVGEQLSDIRNEEKLFAKLSTLLNKEINEAYFIRGFHCKLC